MNPEESVSIEQDRAGVKITYRWLWPANQAGFMISFTLTSAAVFLFAMLLALWGWSPVLRVLFLVMGVGAACTLWYQVKLFSQTELLITGDQIQSRTRPFGWLGQIRVPARGVRYLFSEASIFRPLGEGPGSDPNRPPQVCYCLTALLDDGRKVCLIPNIATSRSAQQIVDELHKNSIGRVLPTIHSYEKTQPLHREEPGGLFARKAPKPGVSQPLVGERLLPLLAPQSFGRLILTLTFALVLGSGGLMITSTHNAAAGWLVSGLVLASFLAHIVQLVRHVRVQQVYQLGSAVAMARVREMTQERGEYRVRLEFMPTHTWNRGPVTVWAGLKPEVFAELEENQAVTVRYATANPCILLIENEVFGSRLGQALEARS